MTHHEPIFEGEAIRYTGDRHAWNNGFRRLWLAMGARDAAVINAARRGDLETVLARVDKMGGVRARIGIARSIIKAAQKLTSDVPDHSIEQYPDGTRMVSAPSLTWVFKNGRQVGKIEQIPLWGVRA